MKKTVRAKVPGAWREYACGDYFSSPLAANGYWDEGGGVWLIVPSNRIEEHSAENFLQVGRPGVDSIGWGYRRRKPGFWAFHPMEGRFQYLAPSVEEFLEGWLAGRISV